MSQFTEFESFQNVSGTHKQYKLNERLIWDIGIKGSDWKLAIEAGTVFDISVPRLLEWVQSPHDRRLLPAAAVHDILLQRGYDVAFASSEFRRAAIARGVLRPWAWVLFFTTLVWTVVK